MRNNVTTMRKALFASATVSALAVSAFAGPVSAQNAVYSPADCDEDGVCDDTGAREEAGASDGAIVVTGSRIRRPELVGSEPITSISDEYYEDRNITNVADALNELPQFRGSVTPAGSQSSFGNGVNFINTFGLGSNRTLTLVNGNRVVSSNVPSLFGPGGAGTQVDLNSIPTILIKRIDAVSVGGAPVYGSDAIAGTVNIILNDKYDGLSVNAQTGVTERGDSFSYNISGLAGMDFDEGRGNFTVAASFDQLEGLRGIARDFNRENVGFLRNCTSGNPVANDGRLNTNIGCNTGPDDGVPPRVRFRNVSSPFLSYTGVISELLNQRQFDASGNLVDVVPVNNIDGFFGSTGNQTPNTYVTSDQTQITSDIKRFSTFAFASYEVAPGVELFAEGMYYNAEARELGSNPIFNTFVFGPTSVSGGLTFDVASNPFLKPAVKSELLGLGLTQFELSKSADDIIDQSAFSKTELKRGVVGVRGDFGALGRLFNYSASFNYGTVDINNVSENINQQNFINAVSFTTDANGNAVCTTTPVVAVAGRQPVQPLADPNCVPLNLFGRNQASAAARDYVTEMSNELANLRQWVFNANVGGELFDIWSGPVSFNVGYEHRDEKASFTPSEFAQSGRGRGAQLSPTAGRYNLDEVFGEVLVPLISPENNVPLLYSADVFGRVRYVDNTVNGGFTSFAAGGSISPVRDLMVRGNFTSSFRSPAITELFLPQSPTFERPADLCRDSAIGTGPNPDIRRANCTAFLNATNNDPATYVLLAASASVAGLNGGNPNLENEKADSFTVGAVLRPRFIPGLTITADYVNIEITDPITSLDTDDLTTGCFDNPSFDTNDPINGNQFCTQLGFNANGQIPNTPTNPAVVSGFVNGQSYEFEGITGVLDYGTGLDRLGIGGRLNVGVDGLYVIRRFNDPIGVGAQVSDGLLGDPRFSAQARLRYSDDNWGFGTYVNFIGKQIVSVNDRGPNPNDIREIDSYDPYATVNMNVFFQTEDNFRLNFAVTNVFDRIGQPYFGNFVAINDEIGRRFRVSVSKEF
jgi:outer membrane receptor protein involved in Fe transport